MDTQEQRIALRAVIKKQYESYFGTQKYETSNLYSTYSSVTEKAMQEYADLRCKPLVEALEKAKGLIGQFRLKESPPTQETWEQIEKALQDYKK